MYLSRLLLNNGSRPAARDLSSAYSLHQTLRWAFPGAGEQDAPLPSGERLLWRDDGARGVLVQSVTEPDWQGVEDRWPGYFATPPEVRSFDLSGLRSGDELMFRLRANVTVSRFRDDQDKARDPRTRRQALRGAPEQVAWLRRQGERGGFDVIGTDIVQSGNLRLYKSGNPKPMTLFAVTFEGLLRVEDASRLADTLQAGIGKAKALGFGLLSLARGGL